MRVYTACELYDIGAGTCSTKSLDHPDTDCDIPVTEDGCDSNDSPTNFRQIATKHGRDSYAKCGCEICATREEFCDPQIPRLGFYRQDGDGYYEHTPSCCHPNSPAEPTCNAVQGEGQCHFPFIYEEKPYNSCTIEDAPDLWCSFTANYDEDDAGWGPPISDLEPLFIIILDTYFRKYVLYSIDCTLEKSFYTKRAWRVQVGGLRSRLVPRQG